MSNPRDKRQKDLLHPALDQVVDPGHPLVSLVQKIDWHVIDEGRPSRHSADPVRWPVNRARRVSGTDQEP